MTRLSYIYIEDCKRGISNELDYTEDGKPMYAFWLTPEQAKSACIIERKETIEEVCEWLKSYRQETYDGTGYIEGIVNDKTIEDLRKAMEE